MQKLILASAISALTVSFAAPAFATNVTTNDIRYTTTAVSARTAISVQAASAVSVYYVDETTAGTGSDPSRLPPHQQPIDLVRSGNWVINTANGHFSGEILYGDYKTQVNVAGSPAIDARQTFTNVIQTFDDYGTWVTPTHLTYTKLNTTVGGGGASTQTETSSSCSSNAAGVSVCTAWAAVTPDWEGLTLDFYFSTNHYYFSGTLTGIDTSGAGATRNTTTIVWLIDGIDPPAPVPIPTPAWLFGSSLLGLAGAARRRGKTI